MISLEQTDGLRSRRTEVQRYGVENRLKPVA
jgi:hypothetical protein